MKIVFAIASSLLLLAGTADAGFRSSLGGFRSSSSRSFSRSYSALRSTYVPCSYNSSRNTTVIQNHNYAVAGAAVLGPSWADICSAT